MSKLVKNRLYYTGDVNPEYGGMFYYLDSYGNLNTYAIIEFSPISFSNVIFPIYLDIDDNATHDQIIDAYYESEYQSDINEGFYFMKAIDKEYTNESNLDIIDKFMRYDFNIWNVAKAYMGFKPSKGIYTYNGKF